MTAEKETERGRLELEKKLTAAAMLRQDGTGALSGDFEKIRERIDRVVASPIAAGEPTRGPIHTADYPVKPAGEAEGARRDQPAEGENPLLRQAVKYDVPYLAVPRVVGEAE